MQSSQWIVYNDNRDSDVKDEDHVNDTNHDYGGNGDDWALNVTFKLS